MAIYQAIIEAKDDTRDLASLQALKDELDALIGACLDQADAGILYGSLINPDNEGVISYGSKASD